MAVTDYSTTPADNTSISGTAVSDSTPVDSVDNIIRQMMADIRSFYDEALLSSGGEIDISAAAPLLKLTDSTDGSHSFIQYNAATLTISADPDASAASSEIEFEVDNAVVGNLSSIGRLFLNDGIAHRGNTDNFISFNTDSQAFHTGDVQRMQVNNNGFQLASTGVEVTTILDEDDMASDSATALVTQQSVKAYVDWTYTTEADLTNGGANDLSESEFNSLPSGITEIEVLLSNAGESAGALIAQLSTGSSYVETGYQSSVFSSAGDADATTGFALNTNTTLKFSGVLRLVKGSGNKWFGSHGFGKFGGGGDVDLGGVLDGVRIATTSGTLDSGTAQVRYR